MFLDKKATAAWKSRGEVRKAVNSCIITDRLKLDASCVGMQDMRSTYGGFMSIISVYAPTYRDSVSTKKTFYDSLQDTLDRVPVSDFLLILGDFNARVGKQDLDSNLWKRIIGYHGLVERNQAGENLLQFCELNHLRVLNTWFQKKTRNMGTWMHPATKNWYTIDYVLTRLDQRRFCNDAGVVKGAN